MAFLILILVLAVYYDLRERRIPNPLIVAGLAAGLAVSVRNGGSGGVLDSVAASAAGMALLLPFFHFRQLGAGDVKLVGVVGSFVGLDGIWRVLLYTFLAGGVLAAVAVVAAGKLHALLESLGRWLRLLPILKKDRAVPLNHFGVQSVLRVPYAVAIAAGSFAWMMSKP